MGTVIAFNTAGIEFSMTALFVTVFVEQWLSTKNHLPAITVVLLLCRKVMDMLVVYFLKDFFCKDAFWVAGINFGGIGCGVACVEA